MISSPPRSGVASYISRRHSSVFVVCSRFLVVATAASYGSLDDRLHRGCDAAEGPLVTREDHAATATASERRDASSGSCRAARASRARPRRRSLRGRG